MSRQYKEDSLISDGQVHSNAKYWEISYLRKKCRNLNLETCYNIYISRLNTTTTSLLIFMYISLTCTTVLKLCFSVNHNKRIILDILIYTLIMAVAVGLLLLNFREKLAQRPVVIFWINFGAVSVMILRVVTWHVQDAVELAYDVVTIILIYYAFPFRTTWQRIFVGIIASIAFGLMFFVNNYSRHSNLYIFSIIFGCYSCLNIMGIMFCLSREYAIRVSLLNRRQLLEDHLYLKEVENNEKIMMRIILPPEIVDNIKEDIYERINIDKQKQPVQMDHLRRTLYIEPHPDASVLFADVVGYTNLTTKLDVKTLVELLNDLFVQFDTTAEKHNVLPIKFLGDCYVCAAGIPLPNPYHAKCCVNLGLDMIDVLRALRDKYSLDIDMRIGVHSGEIFSGVIGIAKWHLDIWSRDVDIANRMEHTGKAGYVHITEQTLNLLDDEYEYKPCRTKDLDDPILLHYNLKTFLVSKIKEGILADWETNSNRNMLRSTFLKKRNEECYFSTAKEMRDLAASKMTEEVYKMPIGRIYEAALFNFSKKEDLTSEDAIFKTNMTIFMMQFTKRNFEWRFMNEPDVFYKYFALMALLVGVTVTVLLQRSTTFHYDYISGTFLAIMVVGCIVVLFKKLWLMYVSKAIFDRPTFRIFLGIFLLSDFINRYIYLRIIFYLLFIGIPLSMCLLLLMNCRRNVFELELIVQILLDGAEPKTCFEPHMIITCFVLVIMLSFLFSQIPFPVKMGVSISLVALFNLICVVQYDFVFDNAMPTNSGLSPLVDIAWYIFAIEFILFIMERHVVYIAKVDYTAKNRMLIKRNKIRRKTESIKVIINNILPSHVAERFFERQLGSELFSEKCSKVAVMFACIENYNPEIVGLRVLNEIICYFDELLNTYNGRIEKIKVVGWTYMAACGLNAVSQAKSALPSGVVQFAATHAEIRGTSVTSEMSSKEKSFNEDDDQVVYSMTEFAVGLLRIMNDINIQNIFQESFSDTQGGLKIGISHGPIVAGVVGMSKPHYDIWGHPVNMASRMSSTGIQGKIQVTENTAKTLRGYNIKSEYRGMTPVKGIGDMPTYFVAINKDFEFVTNKK